MSVPFFIGGIMKISIGNKREKNIDEIIQTNVENGYSIYSDGEEFFVEVLTDGLVYITPDANFKLPE